LPRMIWDFIHPASPDHPAPPGRARGVRRKQMRGKRRGKFPRVWWPRLVSEKGRSSSSLHRLPHAVKACRRQTCSHAARRVNARPSIYHGLPRVLPHSPLLPSLLSTKPLEQWRASATMTARRTMASAGAPCTNGSRGRRTQRRSCV
jgi:hypothetical protein